MKKIALFLIVAAILGAGVMVANAQGPEPVGIPVAFQLLTTDGDVYRNGWVLEWAEGKVIVIDNPAFGDVITIPLVCCGACDAQPFVPAQELVEQPDGPAATPGDPTDVPDPTPDPTPVPPDPTPDPEPDPEPTANCNRGLGNGSEGCDPGNSGGRPGNAGEGNE